MLTKKPVFDEINQLSDQFILRRRILLNQSESSKHPARLDLKLIPAY